MIDIDEAVVAEQREDEVFAALARGDELAVRDLMARIAVGLHERERLLEASAAILERYKDKLATIDRRIAQYRESLQTFIVEHNAGEKVGFPDVGTAYLRKNKAKAKVIDPDLLRVWWDEQYGAGKGIAYVKTFEAKSALNAALEGLTLTAGGQLIDDETGELEDPPPGVDVEAESKSLAIRGAGA